MTFYVDDLTGYGQAAKPGAERHFGNGKQSCHLSTDGELEELHKFAESIGLQRAWFQDSSSLDHYDLTPGKRQLALQKGAVAVSTQEMLAKCGRRAAALRAARLTADNRFVRPTGWSRKR